MPRARWGISAGDIDEFDRDSQFKLYKGPIPPNAVYLWKIKVLKFVSGTREKHPQLRIGLELVPRSGHDEKRFAGYFIMSFRAITPKSNMFYVPFLDAIGVSGTDFAENTITDEEGNVKKIGRWRNTGEQLIYAQLKDGQDADGNKRQEVGLFEAYDDEELDDTEEEEYEEQEEAEDFEDEEEEPAPRQRRGNRSNSRTNGRTNSARTTPPRRGSVSNRRKRYTEEDPF